jgi:hypothetical protein
MTAWRIWRAAALAAALGSVPAWGYASGQTVAKPGAPRDMRASGGVIKPPQGVDPGIKARVPPAAHFPTPVIKPPVAAGGTATPPKD